MFNPFLYYISAWFKLMDLQIKNEEHQMLKIFLLTLQIPFFFL